MEVMLVIALVLFLIQIATWLVLPGGKGVAESSLEFSSLGDEAHAQMMVASK